MRYHVFVWNRTYLSDETQTQTQVQINIHTHKQTHTHTHGTSVTMVDDHEEPITINNQGFQFEYTSKCKHLNLMSHPYFG